MGTGTVLDSAQADVAVACAALKRLQTLDYWQIPELDLLAFASAVEGVARLTYAAQVRVAGEIDTRNTAALFGSSAPASLLRETLTISAADAKARLSAASMTLPQITPTGMKTDPVLPELAAAMTRRVDRHRTDPHHRRHHQSRRHPTSITGLLETGEDTCWSTPGASYEPKPFAGFAKMVALSLDPDGKLNDKDPSDRVELTIGTRNPDTGMTGFKGQLDDLGVEMLGQAINGYAKPQPVDGEPDHRTPKVRNGQALKEVLRRFLNLGDAPTHGGQRPHITLTMNYQDLRDRIGAAYLELGGVITPGEARLLACDADIIPAVLGSTSEVLDVGRAQRLFTPAIRKAITLGLE